MWGLFRSLTRRSLPAVIYYSPCGFPACRRLRPDMCMAIQPTAPVAGIPELLQRGILGTGFSPPGVSHGIGFRPRTTLFPRFATRCSCCPTTPLSLRIVSAVFTTSILAVYSGCHAFGLPSPIHGFEPHHFLPSLCERSGVEPALSSLLQFWRRLGGSNP